MPFPELSSVGSWQDLDARISTRRAHWTCFFRVHYARPTEELDKLAQEIQWERRGNPFECVLELNDALFRSIEYAPNTTKVDSPIDDALQRTARRLPGFCAHHDSAFAKASDSQPLRQRVFVHAEESHDRSSAGATHAWVEAFIPSLGWIAFDPTNNLLCGERHIRVAVGRDYADVPPTRGVYKGEAESELSVSVIVSEVDSPAPQELPPATVIRSRPVKFDSMDPRQGQQQQ